MYVHDIDPVLVQLGPLAIHWYGIMYLIGFFGAWGVMAWRARQPRWPWTVDEVGDLLFYGALGVILGGRVGYMLFYQPGQWLADPLEVFRIWEGGMSFHGGLLGVLVAMLWFARKTNRTFFEVSDFAAVVVPIGLGAGRIGNFIGGELWGKPTDLPWGVVFPTAGDELARHPSQLYQAALEGVVLFLILWFFSSKPRPAMTISGLFALMYGLFRLAVEFVRQPDAHLGYLAFGWVTMGQVLSLPLVLIGIVLIWLGFRRKKNYQPLPNSETPGA